jgi:predicted ATPase/DNA-binding XRE family transcriptional regulator
MASSRPVSFGALLKRYRLAAGLTQEDLAERAGLSAKGISDLERGARQQPRLDTLHLLVAALQLTDAERALLEAAARQRDELAPLSPLRPRESAPPAPAASLPTWPVIGRTQELALLEQHLAGEGPPLLLLAGEPGIGKSRLLQEASARAAGQGWTVLPGGCHRRSGQDLYAPLVEALEGYLRRQTLAQQRLSLQGCAWLARLLPDVAEMVSPPAQGWTIPPEQERRLLFAAVARYLENVGGPRGTLLVLDDLQWAGQDALDLLAFLLHTPTPHPLRVLGAYRDIEVRAQAPLSLLLTDLMRQAQAQRLLLDPLSTEEARALLTAVLADLPEQSQALRQQVMQRSGGVPFFLVSWAQAVRAGALGKRDQPTQGSIPEVPWSVAELIRQRVTALPAPAQELLGIAAVAGRVTPRSLLLAVATTAGHSEPEVLEALEAACQARLLAELGENAYTFVHDLIRETISADLSAARRAWLHRQIAQTMEQWPAAAFLPALAYHYGQSGDTEKAIVYLERAGAQASSLQAHSEALGYYEDLVSRLDGLGRSAHAAQAREQVGQVLTTLAHYEEALSVLEEAAASYRALNDLEGLGRVTAQMGWVYALAGSVEAGIVCLTPLLEFARQGQVSPKTAALLFLALGRLNFVSGQYPEQLLIAETAAEHARLAQDDHLLGQAEMQRGITLQWEGRLVEASQALEEALPLLEAAGDLANLGWVYQQQASLSLYRGEFAQAQRHYKQGLEVAERLGDPWLMVGLIISLGLEAFCRGAWEESHQQFERAQAISQRQTSPSWVTPYPLFFLGLLYQAEGQREQATRSAQEASRLAELLRNRNPLRLAQSVLAEQDLLDGHPQQALDRLLPLLEQRGQQKLTILLVVYLCAWAYLEIDDTTQADQIITQAITDARATQNCFALVNALRVQAQMLIEQDQWQEAAAVLEEALTLAQAMPYPHAEAKALSVYGRLHQRRGEPALARERWQAGLAICQRLGERLYAQQMEEALARLEPEA